MNKKNWFKKYKSEIIIFTFFILISIVWTYPLIFKLNSIFIGGHGDSSGTIWYTWWFKKAWKDNISNLFCPIIATPFGHDYSNTIPYHFTDTLVFIFSNIFGEISSYNIILFLGFPFSAITMYFLIHYFTKNKIISMISGLIYSLCPYHYLRIQGHILLSLIGWIPLYFLFLFKFDEKKTFKSAITWGFVFSFLFLMSYYYGFFTILLTILFFMLKILYSIVKEKKVGISFSYSLKVFLAGFVFVLIVLPHLLPLFTAIKKEPTDFTRELIQLETYSARIWEYFIPSVGNPFFNKIVSNFVFSHLHGSNLMESTLYLGYVSIIFGIIGIYFLYFSKNKVKSDDNSNLIQKNKNFLLFYLTILLIFSVIISLDPIVNIGSKEIKFPSYYLFKLIPIFRVYTRFYPFILMSLIVIASIGMSKILEKIKSVKYKVIFAMVVILFIIFEFINFPPFNVTDLSKTPDVYKWIKEQPGDFIIVEYPLTSREHIENSIYSFYQFRHQKRMFNGIYLHTYADEIRKIVDDLREPSDIDLLRFYGIKYVIAHDNQPEHAEYKLHNLEKLDLINQFEGATVYDTGIKILKEEIFPAKDIYWVEGDIYSLSEILRFEDFDSEDIILISEIVEDSSIKFIEKVSKIIVPVEIIFKPQKYGAFYNDNGKTKSVMLTNKSYFIPIDVANLGTVKWPKESESPVLLHYRWYGLDKGQEIKYDSEKNKDYKECLSCLMKNYSENIIYEGEKIELPKSISPKDYRTIQAIVKTPTTPGDYILEFDLIDEGLTRFSKQGVPPLLRFVKIVSSEQEEEIIPIELSKELKRNLYKKYFNYVSEPFEFNIPLEGKYEFFIGSIWSEYTDSIIFKIDDGNWQHFYFDELSEFDELFEVQNEEKIKNKEKIKITDIQLSKGKHTITFKNVNLSFNNNYLGTRFVEFVYNLGTNLSTASDKVEHPEVSNQIKSVENYSQQKNTETYNRASYAEDDNQIEYSKISSSEYVVDVNANKPFFLIFNKPFQMKWEAYIEGKKLDNKLCNRDYGTAWFIDKIGNYNIKIKYLKTGHFEPPIIFSFCFFILFGLLSIFGKYIPFLNKQ